MMWTSLILLTLTALLVKVECQDRVRIDPDVVTKYMQIPGVSPNPGNLDYLILTRNVVDQVAIEKEGLRTCKNNHEHCSYWKDQGYCETSSGQYAYMSMECKLACGICNGKDDYDAFVSDLTASGDCRLGVTNIRFQSSTDGTEQTKLVVILWKAGKTCDFESRALNGPGGLKQVMRAAKAFVEASNRDEMTFEAVVQKVIEAA